MSNKVATILILFCLPLPVFAQTSEDTLGINQRYRRAYDFITMEDTVYTFETEFTLPGDFRHPDSSELTNFQNYVAHFPLWHRYLPVGEWKGGTLFERTEISRPVHLPHIGLAFTDRAIPIRILAEYLHDRGRELELEVIPNAGDTLKYSKWLHNEVVYGARKSVQYRPIPPRDTTLKEYYKFMKTCMHNTTYKSLTSNCDSVARDDVSPGDLFVAHSENGRKGMVYVVMHMVVNDKGERLYIVATGCEKPCDFHIPLLSEDRNYPWITVKQIAELGQSYPHTGFYRLKID